MDEYMMYTLNIKKSRRYLFYDFVEDNPVYLRETDDLPA